MAAECFSVNINNIALQKDLRFSPSYFYVDTLFAKLEKKYKVHTLSDLGAKISSGSYIDTYIGKEFGVPFIRVGNIKPFCIDETPCGMQYVSAALPDKIKLSENDILVGRTQATPEKLGVACIINNNQAGSVISQHVSKISIESISPYYLVAYLNSNFYKAQTALATHGDTRVEMTHLQMQNIKVFLPEDAVVEDIVNKVKRVIKSNADALNLIQLAQQRILRKIATAPNLNNTFTVNKSSIEQADLWTPHYALPLYVDTLKSIKSKYKTVRLGDIVTLQKGDEVGSNNYTDYLEKSVRSVPFIRTSDIVNYETDQYPDYYIAEEIFTKLAQDMQAGDVLFSKDGKIGMVGMLTEYDRAIIGSGFVGLRLTNAALQQGITPEYLFTALSIKEIGLYEAKRRTVVASTIPHLREERVCEMEIPILDHDTICEITDYVREAFKLKAERKRLIVQIRQTMDSYFEL